jgi:hypothetical protein
MMLMSCQKSTSPQTLQFETFLANLAFPGALAVIFKAKRDQTKKSAVSFCWSTRPMSVRRKIQHEPQINDSKKIAIAKAATTTSLPRDQQEQLSSIGTALLSALSNSN